MQDLLLQALSGHNASRPPIWLMRQAGRYMPEYRTLRSQYSFLEMVHQPELAAKVTLLPIELLDVDAAILFCDILVIAEALQRGLHFDEGAGPIIDRPITSAAEIDALPEVDLQEQFAYVERTIKLLRPQLKVPLIGFAGAPFTLASYLIEGRSSRDLRKTKHWMLKDPVSFHRLLDRLATIVGAYLNFQIAAGAQAVQIFDSWAHVLAPRQFEEFSLSYFRQVIRQLPPETPSIAFCRGSALFAPQLSTCGATALSIDWQGNLADLRERLPKRLVLQGNLDPDILYAPQPVIRREVEALLKSMRGDRGYIFNLGHGVLPDIPFENVKFLVDVVKSASP